MREKHLTWWLLSPTTEKETHSMRYNFNHIHLNWNFPKEFHVVSINSAISSPQYFIYVTNLTLLFSIKHSQLCFNWVFIKFVLNLSLVLSLCSEHNWCKVTDRERLCCLTICLNEVNEIERERAKKKQYSSSTTNVLKSKRSPEISLIRVVALVVLTS